MRTAFVNPPFLPKFSRGQRSPGVTKSGTLYYPYWLTYACGWAQKSGFEVYLFDFVASKDNFVTAVKKIKKFNPQLVVIEASTPSIFNDLRFAKRIKRKLNCFVLLAGTHVSALPKWTLKQAPQIDAVAVGEYDQTVVDLAKALQKKADLNLVNGLVFREGKAIIANQPRALLKNLDDFPFVSQIYQQFLNPKDYYFAAADYPMVMMITGRGCPFGCFYCLYPQVMHGLKYRFRKPQNVVAEFEYIKTHLPEVKEVVIEDDTFTTNLPRVQDICRLLIKNKNQLKWSTNVRVHLDLKTMRLMKQAGCRLLIVGYESGSQKVLNGMDKKIRLADSLKFARNAKTAGLLVHGCFMVGNPGETRKTMQQTLEFAKTLDPDSAQFYPLFVYPGTRAFAWAERNGYLKTTNFNRWLNQAGGHQTVVDLPHLSAQDMMDFCNQAYRQFHLRPAYLLKKLVQLIHHPDESARSIRSALRYFKNLL